MGSKNKNSRAGRAKKAEICLFYGFLRFFALLIEFI